MKMEFSAGGLIYCGKKNKYQFLLILNSYDQWTFPKGHIEKGEKPEIAALREVSEETGLENLEIKAKLDKIDYWFKQEGILYHKFVYFYLIFGDQTETIKHQEAEVKDAQWFPVSEVENRLFYKEDKKLFNQALETLRS